MNTDSQQHTIKVRKTESAWLAYSPELMIRLRSKAQSGEGSSPQEAIAAFVLNNAEHYRIYSVVYDMTDPMTISHVTTNSISNTKLK